MILTSQNGAPGLAQSTLATRSPINSETTCVDSSILRDCTVHYSWFVNEIEPIASSTMYNSCSCISALPRHAYTPHRVPSRMHFLKVVDTSAGKQPCATKLGVVVAAAISGSADLATFGTNTMCRCQTLLHSNANMLAESLSKVCKVPLASLSHIFRPCAFFHDAQRPPHEGPYRFSAGKQHCALPMRESTSKICSHIFCCRNAVQIFHMPPLPIKWSP